MLIDAYGTLIPDSRVELYLAKICGDDVDLPIAPLTRIEKYLDNIVKNGSIKNGGVVAVLKLINSANEDVSVYINETEYSILSGETKWVPILEPGTIAISPNEPEDLIISNNSVVIEENIIYDVTLSTIDFTDPSVLMEYGLVLSNTINDSVSFNGRYAVFTTDQSKVLCSGLGNTGYNTYVCLSKDSVPQFTNNGYGQLVESQSINAALQSIGLTSIRGYTMGGWWSIPVTNIIYTIKGNTYSSGLAIFSNITGDNTPATINNIDVLRLVCEQL